MSSADAESPADPGPGPVPPGRGGMAWWGWGPPGEHEPLAADVRELVEAVLAAPRRDTPPVPAHAVELPPSRLAEPARAELAAIVGAGWVRTDRASRLERCRGRSTPDLLRLRAGDGSDAPDAVVLPAGHDEVLAVLARCAARRLTVVPFGGGTSVVGGLRPDRPDQTGRAGAAATVCVDLGRLDRLVELDETSLLAVCEPGLRGPALEEALGRRGLTLGHFPQSWEYATLGGYAATRSAGQASAGYGRFADRVVALRVATPRGGWELGRGPASAAGPDLRQLVLGSEGAFGIITGLTLAVSARPPAARYDGWRLPGFAAGLRALRELARSPAAPTMARLSDETETAVGLATPESTGSGAGPDSGGPDSGGSGCLLVTGFEGDGPDVAARRERAATIIRSAGGSDGDPAAGEAWRRGRFRGPYLRDALLDVGLFAETLETATRWRDLPALHAAVRTALTDALTAFTGAAPLVMCHVSHVYPTGASLYFTVAGRQVAPDAGPDAAGDAAGVAALAAGTIAAWTAAKAAATDAMVAAGATITHHHAVGSDHRPWLGAEIGPLGLDVLRAVKATLDPGGILNPGVLV